MTGEQHLPRPLCSRDRHCVHEFWSTIPSLPHCRAELHTLFPHPFPSCIVEFPQKYQPRNNSHNFPQASLSTLEPSEQQQQYRVQEQPHSPSSGAPFLPPQEGRKGPISLPRCGTYQEKPSTAQLPPRTVVLRSSPCCIKKHEHCCYDRFIKILF